METVLEELIKKWESELGSYIPNIPIYKMFIDEAKSYVNKDKEDKVNFAKKHVTEALNQAKDKAICGIEFVDDESILTAYPLENIKL